MQKSSKLVSVVEPHTRTTPPVSQHTFLSDLYKPSVIRKVTLTPEPQTFNTPVFHALQLLLTDRR